MKTLYAIFIFAISAQALFAQDVASTNALVRHLKNNIEQDRLLRSNEQTLRGIVYLPSNETDYFWDSAAWVAAPNSITYSYNANCAVETMVTSSNSAPLSRSRFSYDPTLVSQGYLGAYDTVFFDNWDGSSWVFWGMEVVTYYPNGYIKSEITTMLISPSVWDTVSGSNRIRTFDSNWNPLEYTRQKYDVNTHTFVNQYYYEYLYNSAGQFSGDEYDYWDGTSFIPSTRDSDYTYNYYNSINDFQLNHYIQLIADSTGWLINGIDTLIYDNTGSYQQNVQAYDGNNWFLSIIFTYSQDEHGNYIGESYKQWDGTQWSLFWQDSVLITYDANGGITQKIYQDMDYYTLGLVNSYWQDYSNLISCNEPEAVEEPADASGLISVFPNPTFGPVTIELNDPGSAITFYFTDLSGRILNKQKITGGTDNTIFNIDLSQYPSGNYFIKAVSDGNVVVKQLQLIK